MSQQGSHRRGGKVMNPVESMKHEVLRLAKAGNKCIRTYQLSNLFNVPDKRIRQELAKLADQKVIHLAGWDGRKLRPYSSWPNSEEFVNSDLDRGHLRVELVTADEANQKSLGFAAGQK
jgi:hypothetical protein